MSYGFVFPKRGYGTDAAVKNLAWRDDQQVFLASNRQTKTINLSSGTNIHNGTYTMDLDVPFDDFFVYRSYLWAQWGGNSRTYLADNCSVVTFGGQSFMIFTYFYSDGNGNASLRFSFIKTGSSGVLTSNVTLTFSAYICLQSILDNGLSGNVGDTGATGLKISLPGYDVQNCTPKQCSLHSEYTALKSRKIGQINLSANTWAQVAHNFGYEPAYWGYFTGTFGGLSGIAPFGGIPDLSGTMTEDSRLQSYVTTDKLYLYSTTACTAYYYLFADQAGKAEATIPQDTNSEYGLIITEPGADIRTATPNKYRFCSDYPNLKVHSEMRLAIPHIYPPTTTTRVIDQNDTTIYYPDASSFGDRGEFYIAKTETTNREEWHWVYAPLAKRTELNGYPLTDYNYDDEIANGGLNIDIHVDGTTFSGHYDGQGGFTGNAKFEGDNGNRRFFYLNGGSWNECNWDYGQTNSWTTGYDDCYTWYSGGSRWVECYYPHDWDSPVMYTRQYYTQTTTYYQEKCRFTGWDGNGFTGVTRGIDGTTARTWQTGSYLVPATMVYRLSNVAFNNYNPCFMAWTQGVYENEGAQSYPTQPYGSPESANVIISDHKYWLVVQRSFSGQYDSWITDPTIYILPNVYIKTFYDEIGT